jgi:hypothetical protein
LRSATAEIRNQMTREEMDGGHTSGPHPLSRPSTATPKEEDQPMAVFYGHLPVPNTVSLETPHFPGYTYTLLAPPAKQRQTTSFMVLARLFFNQENNRY